MSNLNYVSILKMNIYLKFIEDNHKIHTFLKFHICHGYIGLVLLPPVTFFYQNTEIVLKKSVNICKD